MSATLRTLRADRVAALVEAAFAARRRSLPSDRLEPRAGDQGLVGIGPFAGKVCR